MTRYKAFSKHPTGIDSRSVSSEKLKWKSRWRVLFFFFFFSKFRERKKEPGINHRDEHSVYAKIEHLEIKQSGGRNGVAMRILTRGESIFWSNNRWRNEKKKRKERKEGRKNRERASRKIESERTNDRIRGDRATNNPCTRSPVYDDS